MGDQLQSSQSADCLSEFSNGNGGNNQRVDSSRGLRCHPRHQVGLLPCSASTIDAERPSVLGIRSQLPLQTNAIRSQSGPICMELVDDPDHQESQRIGSSHVLLLRRNHHFEPGSLDPSSSLTPMPGTSRGIGNSSQLSEVFPRSLSRHCTPRLPLVSEEQQAPASLCENQGNCQVCSSACTCSELFLSEFGFSDRKTHTCAAGDASDSLSEGQAAEDPFGERFGQLGCPSSSSRPDIPHQSSLFDQIVESDPTQRHVDPPQTSILDIDLGRGPDWLGRLCGRISGSSEDDQRSLVTGRGSLLQQLQGVVSDRPKRVRVETLDPEEDVDLDSHRQFDGSVIRQKARRSTSALDQHRGPSGEVYNQQEIEDYLPTHSGPRQFYNGQTVSLQSQRSLVADCASIRPAVQPSDRPVCFPSESQGGSICFLEARS